MPPPYHLPLHFPSEFFGRGRRAGEQDLFLWPELRQDNIYYQFHVSPAWSRQNFLQVREFFREGMGFRYLDALKPDPPTLLSPGLKRWNLVALHIARSRYQDWCCHQSLRELQPSVFGQSYEGLDSKKVRNKRKRKDSSGCKKALDVHVCSVL